MAAPLPGVRVTGGDLLSSLRQAVSRSAAAQAASRAAAAEIVAQRARDRAASQVPPPEGNPAPSFPEGGGASHE